MQKTDPGQHRQTTTTPKVPAPIIARRKSCNPDGVGLSHYVLMDRKKAK
ncbi:MAG: modified peptide precursor CbpA [Pseudomonadota bacterium]